jgi:hypothetical protein
VKSNSQNSDTLTMGIFLGWHKTTTVSVPEPPPRPQLGQMLLQNELINEVQLLQGLHYHKTHGVRLGEALVSLNFITETAIKTVLAKQLNIKMMPVDYLEFIPPNLTGYITKEYAWRHKVCPIRRANDHLTIVINDPTDDATIDFIHHSTQLQITVNTAPEAMILQVLHRLYGPPGGPVS